MVARIILTALAAGLISGVFIWGAHMVKTTPLILAAEVYENSAPGGMIGGPAEQRKNQTAAPQAEAAPSAPAAEEAWVPSGGTERTLYTLLMDVITSIGFAFLLVGAISLSGREIDWRRGILWGVSGFAAVFLSPSLGLAPELPGMQAADLSARQAWWLGTVVATAAGLALLALQRKPVLRGLGLGLILLPHLIGAPLHAGGAGGGVPAELASEFAVATLAVTGLFWVVLGGLTGYFYNRFEQT